MLNERLYHAFIVDDDKYLYMTNYKQLFLISDQEYKFLESPDSRSYVLDKYAELINEIDAKQAVKREDRRFGLFLCVSNSCNAKCSYCFAHQGDYGRDRGFMPAKMAYKAIDCFMSKVPYYADAYIIFFGGEPLMAFDTICDACEYTKLNYCGVKDFKFQVVTNATLLTEKMIDYFADNDFGIAVSIDGGSSIQNKQRTLANGKDSYFEATKNLSYLLNSIYNVHARGTYIDFDYPLPKLYSELLNLGFREVDIPPDILHLKNSEQMNALMQQLDALYLSILDYMNGHEDFPFGLFTTEIRRLFIPKLDSPYSCGVGKTTFSVDINGNLYPCHRFCTDDDKLYGNIMNESSIEFKENHFVDNKCRDCWNQYTCSHGCAYNDVHNTDGTYAKHIFWCCYAKKMTELTLALCARMKPDTLRRVLCIPKTLTIS